MKRLFYLFLCLVTVGCGGKPEKADSDNRPAVQVVKPGVARHEKVLKFPGVTESGETANLSFQASGEILELRKEVGDRVRRGEFLGRVNSSAQLAQVNVARAQVASAQAQHQELLSGARTQEIASDQAQVRAAQASVAQAKANLGATEASLKLAEADRDRYRKVFEAEALPKQQMDQAETQYSQALAQHQASQRTVQQAEQQLQQAKQQLSLRREGATREQIASSAANVQAAASQVAQAESQLAFTELRAPFSGIISRKNAEVGDLASPGQAVYELRSELRPELVIQVPSLHINNIEDGMTAELTFLQLPEQKFPARVSEIQTVNDANSRNYQVKLTMKEWPLGRELSGVIGTAYFTLEEGEDAYRAPVSALKRLEGQEQFGVFLEKDGRVTLTPVVMVTVQDEEAVFQAPIPDGAGVVISGQEYIRDGQEVRVVEALDAQKLVSPNKKSEESEQAL